MSLSLFKSPFSVLVGAFSANRIRRIPGGRENYRPIVSYAGPLCMSTLFLRALNTASLIVRYIGGRHFRILRHPLEYRRLSSDSFAPALLVRCRFLGSPDRPPQPSLGSAESTKRYFKLSVVSSHPPPPPCSTF